MRLDQKISALSAPAVFRGLEPQALHVLAFSASVRRLKAGEELFRQGEAADGGYVIVTGRLSISPDGVAVADDGQLGPGGLIGETALIAENERPQTVFALEPATLLFIPRTLMREVLVAHPASAATLRNSMATRLAAMAARLGPLA